MYTFTQRCEKYEFTFLLKMLIVNFLNFTSNRCRKQILFTAVRLAHLPIFGYQLQADLNVLVDLQHIQQIPEAVLKQDGQDLPVAVKMPIGTADNSNFSDTEHESNRGLFECSINPAASPPPC